MQAGDNNELAEQMTSWRGSIRALCAAVVLGLASCATQNVAVRVAPPPRSPLTEPPGAINEDVKQSNIGSTICVPGWTATVRPSTSYTQALKRKMLKDAGLPISDERYYELDHFVPLALGGNPRSLDNLWLQPWHGEWGAGIKDQLERRLQLKVCRGEMDLSVARLLIQHDWKAALMKYVANTQAGDGLPRELEPVE